MNVFKSNNKYVDLDENEFIFDKFGIKLSYFALKAFTPDPK